MSEYIPSGYVVLARKVRKSPLWLSLKATHRVIMIELLLQASFQDGPVVRGGEIVELKRGQIATSYQNIVDDIADKDITVKVVRNAIEKLVKHDFLTKDEAKARAKQGLLLTIVNYDFYQDTENYKGKAEGKETGIKRAKQGQSEGKARAINNNVNKEKNVKNDEIKIQYAEFVHLTESEFNKLVSEYGEDMTKQCIQVLNNYKGAKGKTYKSDYLATLNWVVSRVKEDNAKIMQFPRHGQAQRVNPKNIPIVQPNTSPERLTSEELAAARALAAQLDRKFEKLNPHKEA